MKLDRNTNADGRGKYAIINLREVPWFKGDAIISTEHPAVNFGNKKPEDRFFVIKYSDPFALRALLAYAQAIYDTAAGSSDKSERDNLFEYVEEIQVEIGIASSLKAPKKPVDIADPDSAFPLFPLTEKLAPGEKLEQIPVKHGHYFRMWKVPGTKMVIKIDWYWIAWIFGPFKSPQDHAMKKIMFAGRRGVKDDIKDINEAIDSLKRWVELLEQEGGGND